MTEDPPRPAGSGPTAEELAQAVRGRRRTAPRYRAFVGAGVLLGVVVAVVLTATSEPAPDAVETFDPRLVLGYTALLLGFVGGLLGAVVALVLDRRSR